MQDLLRDNGITEPPVNVELVAASLGIVLRRTPTKDEVSGFLLQQGSGPVMIGVNSLHHPNRQRFTIGHEIGHYVLHDFDKVHVDNFVVKLRSEASSTGDDKEEVEANRFAAELLIPSEMLSKELSELGVTDLLDDRAMQRLAKLFQVSVQAMSNRLISLNYVASTEF